MELVNASNSTLDLGNAELSDATGLRHVFPANTVLQPYEAIVIFGGGTPTFDGSNAAAWCGPLAPSVAVTTASEGGLGCAPAVGVSRARRSCGAQRA